MRGHLFSRTHFEREGLAHRRGVDQLRVLVFQGESVKVRARDVVEKVELVHGSAIILDKSVLLRVVGPLMGVAVRVGLRRAVGVVEEFFVLPATH